jgi:hypothetical protein
MTPTAVAVMVAVERSGKDVAAAKVRRTVRVTLMWAEELQRRQGCGAAEVAAEALPPREEAGAHTAAAEVAAAGLLQIPPPVPLWLLLSCAPFRTRSRQPLLLVAFVGEEALRAVAVVASKTSARGNEVFIGGGCGEGGERGTARQRGAVGGGMRGGEGER